MRHAPPVQSCQGQIADLKFHIKPALIPAALPFQISVVTLYSCDVVAGEEKDITLIHLAQWLIQLCYAPRSTQF